MKILMSNISVQLQQGVLINQVIEEKYVRFLGTNASLDIVGRDREFVRELPDPLIAPLDNRCIKCFEYVVVCFSGSHGEFEPLIGYISPQGQDIYEERQWAQNGAIICR